jgi:tetratricopeptide (TPR) repeat protein
MDGLLARSPADPAASYRRAMFWSDMGRKREALTALDALLATDPTNSAYRRGRAKVLSDLGRSAEAVGEWKTLTRTETDAQSLMNLGWAYWHDKDYDAAWKIASVLVKLDENNPAFLRFMANLEIERMDYPEALRHAQRAETLNPGDRDAKLILSKALFRMQKENAAMAILEKLFAKNPDNAAVKYRWAEFLGRTGRYDEAVLYFDQLIKADPLNETYQLDRAMALYEKGSFDAAVAGWQALAALKTPNPVAVRRLRDDAFNRRDWDGAVAWQKKIIAENPSDPVGWEKLSRIEIAMKQPARALRAAEGSISADPVAINAYYLKSEILETLKEWPEAQAAYEDVVRGNPNSIRAFDGLSYMQDAQGDYRGALGNLARIDALTAPFVSPYQDIHRAALLANLGHHAQAHALLKKLEGDTQTVIPVLLYHGISEFDRSDSIPRDNLRRQLTALKNSGYTTMTVSQLDRVFQGQAQLPVKPILITFDDARTDSFENADPILKDLGMRATMFVHISKLRKPHFHASPEDIARWAATGRWEMQAHGSQAHDPMPIDAFGRKGHFLPNRMWLTAENRLETLPEYRARLDTDYAQAKKGVEDMLPDTKVVAFAYPYGDYGQSDFSNTPEAAGINRALVKKHFHMAFVQEQYGINTLSSNPMDLQRYEVPRYMTAEQLLSHLVMSDPRIQAELLEAQMWLQANQLGQAQALYSDLASRGIDEARVWADQGIAFQKGGDLSYAQNLFARAAAQEPDKDGPGGELDARLLDQYAHAAAPVATIDAQRFTDSDTNAVTKVLARGEGTAGPVRLGAWVGRGDYWDRLNPNADLGHIRSVEGGAQLHWFAVPKLDFDGLYSRRAFSGGASGVADIYALAASFQALPSLRMAVRDGMANVETAAAIRASRRSHTDGAGLVWDPALNWTAGADYDQTRYNDDNRERDLRLRVTKRFSERVAFGVAYFNGDSNSRQPDYYTPRGLNQYTGVLTLHQALGEINPRTGQSPVEGQIQYEAGYGFQPSGSSSVNSVKAVLTGRAFERVTLTVDAQYAQSPLYISRLLDGAVAVKF